MSLNRSKSLRTAEKYVLQGKIPAAIDEYRKVVESDPSDLTTINTLGDLYVRAGRIPDAIQNFSRIADSYRDSGFTLKAIAMLKKISKLDPTNTDTAMKLANLYSQQGLFVEARQQYLQVADAYARGGQTRRALEAYQKIADLDPSNTAVRMKLGEIYSREGMVEQAHDTFVMAGAEFSRRGENEQALNANLKAISINPDSRQALTAIVNIYTQQGQADRAINILCDAFEKNPGDAELLTILGRTYLSAGWMDEAERTFLSLVELDRNRYHYLLEVGRKFLQMGDLDRAAEQIDGCLEVLISKREEDKAIDFLRRILDKDLYHVGSLKRLAEIFQRIREDHNLITTLNTLVDAAMRKGADDEAVQALKELARLEPDEPMHRQRLYNLGVRDIPEPGAPDVVRATGPLDYQSAAFDDAFVIRQISEAEILAGHGQVDHAVFSLKEILRHAPDNLQVHLKLKDIYLRSGQTEEAASECMVLSRIYEARGESSKASDYIAEAQQLNPLIEMQPSAASWNSNGNGGDSGYELPFSASADDSGGFEIRELTGGLDLSRYQTGMLGEQFGFVTLPETQKSAPPPRREAPHVQSVQTPEPVSESVPENQDGFRYSDTLLGEAVRAERAADAFKSTSDLPSDTMSGMLRDELEGVDFYIAQGYVEIAHDTLDRLREEHGEHPEILARYKRLGISASPTQAISNPVSLPSVSEPEDDSHSSGFAQSAEDGGAFLNKVQGFELHSDDVASGGEPMPVIPSQPNGTSPNEDPNVILNVTGNLTGSDAAESKPFLIQKESGPLTPDLMVRFNTTDLSAFANHKSAELPDISFPTGANGHEQKEIGFAVHEPEETATEVQFGDEAQESPRKSGTADLIDSLMSGIDEALTPSAEVKSRLAEAAQPEESAAVEDEKSGSGELPPIQALPESVMTESISAEPRYPAEFAVSTNAPQQPESHGVMISAAELEAEAEMTGYDNNAEADLREMIDGLNDSSETARPVIDYETHYSLGLAYKDMDLHDEAIEQFQIAYRLASQQGVGSDYIHCCHMLGFCFKQKQMPKLAIMWFQRGLKAPNHTEDEYQALRFEIGLCYEGLEELDKAIEVFSEVYGIDVNYRRVSEKLKELQALKNA